MRNIFFVTIIILTFIACTRMPQPVTNPQYALTPVSWWKAAKPNDDMAFKDIADAVHQSVVYFKNVPPENFFYFGFEKLTALDMLVTLQNFLLIVENNSLSYDQKIEQIKNGFILYRSVGSDGQGRVLFTGYYEPVISCRLKEDDVFRYPLYRRPDDMVEVDLSLFGSFHQAKLTGRLDNKKVVPYYSREDIDQKKMLSGKNLEILWCNDLVDIYILQVQGSGKADLGDGTVLSVLYNGQNGRTYNSIGKYLIDSGIMTRTDMSMQAIRTYLRKHPDTISTVLIQNPSYVFFRIDTGSSLGSIGVPLTAHRSIATDSRIFPKGALGLIVSQKPVIENGLIKSWMPFTRFVLNQDTGGAIKGPGRADLYWGQGVEAELGAGFMHHQGELYFLIRKK